jgi:hypothetical protein
MAYVRRMRSQRHGGSGGGVFGGNSDPLGYTVRSLRVAFLHLENMTMYGTFRRLGYTYVCGSTVYSRCIVAIGKPSLH